MSERKGLQNGEFPIGLPEPPLADSGAVRFARKAVRLIFGLTLSFVFLAGLVAYSTTTREQVTAVGVLMPSRTWPVQAQESGLISMIRVRNGDRVEAGDVLGSLDSLSVQMELAGIESSIAEHRMALSRANSDTLIERNQRRRRRELAWARLLQAEASFRDRLSIHGFPPNVDSVRRMHKVGTHVEIDRALSELSSAEVELEDAEAEEATDLNSVREAERTRLLLAGLEQRRALVKKRLARLTLIAPSSGLITTADPERTMGTMASAGATILTISEQTHWVAQLSLTERDIAKVRVGNPVTIELSALEKFNIERLEGVVDQVSNSPENTADAAAARYPVRVRIEVPPKSEAVKEGLRQGYSLVARIITREVSLATVIKEKLGGSAQSVR